MFTEKQVTQLKARLARLKPTLGGKFMFYMIPFRRKVVLANMSMVFGSILSAEEIKKLALCFYSHVATSIKENIAMRFMTLEKIKSCARIVGKQYLEELEGNPVKGAVILTGHFGNWEFAPIAGILNFTDYQNRFFTVRKNLVNKTIEKILFQRYYQAGLEVIPKKNSLEKVCDMLEKNNAVAFVLDQHASLEAKDGMLVEFFGKKAGTFKSMAMIIRYTNVPMLPMRFYRDVDGKHVTEFFPRVPWIECTNPEDEIYVNTRRYNEILEQFVLDYPEQWLWMHRRWKEPSRVNQ